MPVSQWLYLPVSDNCNLDVIPTIDKDAESIAEFVRKANRRRAGAEGGNDDDNDNGNNDMNVDDNDNNDEDSDDMGRFRGGGNNVLKPFNLAHKGRPGWIPVLAWSHGASSRSSRFEKSHGNMQDLSLTKYSDNMSPLFTVMVMCGEIVPHGILRILYTPKNGKFRVIEYLLKNTAVTSISCGGSGGEDRLTENITVEFGSVFMRHLDVSVETGKIVSDSQGFWDDEKHKGTRQGKFTAPSLQMLCKQTINTNIDMYTIKDLALLPKPILAELKIDPNRVHPVIPLRGRKFMITDEELSDSNSSRSKRNHFREIYVKDLTVKGMLNAVAQKYNCTLENVQHVYKIGECLVLLENNDQVWNLSEDQMLSVEFKIKPN